MALIRKATKLDIESIQEVYLRAFPKSENQLVSTLAINLLKEKTNPETMSLVAELDGAIVGHIAFSPVTVDTLKKWKGYILAPLGVKPEYQRQRIGSELIESGIRQITEAGSHVLFVYGDPKYYSKFGFKVDAASRYAPPYKLQYPFGWQAIVFKEIEAPETILRISCVASLCNPELW